MWNLVVIAWVLSTVEGYSFQRKSYQIPKNNGYQYRSASYNRKPGHAYFEKSQYNFLHGSQLANSHHGTVHVPQQILSQYYTVCSPGHAYGDQKQFQFTQGPQIAYQNKVNILHSAPNTHLHVPLNRYGPKRAADHVYVEQSQYEIQHGGQLTNNHYKENIHSVLSPQLHEFLNQYSALPSGHAYVEQSQYEFQNGNQLPSNQNIRNAPSKSSPVYLNEYGPPKSPGHAYVEQSQIEFSHGDQLTNDHNNANSHSAPSILLHTPNQPAPNQYGKPKSEGHVYVDQSQYDFRHNNELTNNHNVKIQSPPSTQIHATSSHDGTPTSGHAYVEQSKYEIRHGDQQSASSSQLQSSNEYGPQKTAGHAYIEQSQYEFRHGDQLTNNQNINIQSDPSTLLNAPSIEYGPSKTDEHVYVEQSQYAIQHGDQLTAHHNNIQDHTSSDNDEPNQHDDDVGAYSLQSAQNEQPVISKHIYFHVPPADEEEPTQPLQPILQPVKKNYKIIFIKVPSQSSYNQELIQQQLQTQLAPSELKTLVYVLVKKSDPEIYTPPPPTVTSKPEVFYVKYNKNAPLEDVNTKISDQH